ncbi:MAG: hypothetical protein EXR27_08105 [Betaproteobacteria bacterium]|nr:hypothetical protein [Betaproteobacteria bacterium]
MKIVSRSDTQQSEIQTQYYRSQARSYFGKLGKLHDGPQVFLVNMPGEGSTIAPHFHDVDQYQVFVRGEGRFGRTAIRPVAFHYADAYSPYGPIVGGKDGISFFTIRAACATGYFPMPGSRHLMPCRAGRNASGSFATAGPPPAAKQSTRESLLALADGVEVVGLRLGPEAIASGEPADAGDQYYLVASGSLVNEGKEVAPLSLIRVTPGESAPVFQAGADGAEVLLLQMPRPTARPGSNPGSIAERGVTDYNIPGGTTIE